MLTLDGSQGRPASPNRRQHAVVFSGNGFNAAYEVGVLKALLHGASKATGYEPIQPSIYTGTSVGAYNAAFMAAHSDRGDIGAVEHLEQSWKTGVAPRFRANPFEYLNPGSYWPNPAQPVRDFYKDARVVTQDLARRFGDLLASFKLTQPLAALQQQVLSYQWDILADIEPMIDQIRTAIPLENIRNSRKALRITAVNWKTGKPKTFENRDFGDETGHRFIAAAMAIPGAVPPQKIDLEDFVDGAMLIRSPLQPAIAARDRRDPAQRFTLHVIYLDPEFGQGPLIDVRGSFSLVYRLFLLAFARSVNADIDRVERTNRDLRFLELLRDLDLDEEVMRLWQRLNQDTQGAVEIEVHRYRSAKHLASLLDIFSIGPEKLHYLIESGYADARLHDCREAGCVGILREADGTGLAAVS